MGLSSWRGISLPEVFLILSVISCFLPVKIYPVVFLISSFLFYRDTLKINFEKWALALALFSLYAIGSFLLTFQGQEILLLNISKMTVNFIFLFFTINWLASRDNTRLIQLMDQTLLVIFSLVLIQLLIYHHAFDFKLILGSSSSGQASSLYVKSLYFWGLEDKNMFGARIALLGFVYLCIPIVRADKISLWRIIFIFALGYLSLSRTPIIALLIGVLFLFWNVANKRWRVVFLIGCMLCLPFLLQKVIRVDNITSSNDGMGIRLVYWKAFFTNFSEISPLGNGFLSAPEFLIDHADFFRGEPHIHNTFMSCYLELGIIGLLSYTSFLVYFFLGCKATIDHQLFWIALFLPLLGIMMILYSGYDNDVILYLLLIYLIGSNRKILFPNLKVSI